MSNQSNQSDQERALGYLKATVTMMMIAFHSVLAYSLYIPASSSTFLAEPRMWRGFPVLDSQRWGGFFIYAGFFDDFGMALMFFISGLFTWKSLSRKGIGTFFRDRFLRLGLPFVILGLLFAPLTYYPSYLITGAESGLSNYFGQWLSQRDWPAGHVWFNWVLLAFNCLFIFIFVLIKKTNQLSAQKKPGFFQHPIAFFGLIVAFSAASYIPLSFFIAPEHWTSFGPFAFQTKRLLHYAAYFFIGTILGNYGIERSLLALDGKLARRWFLWVISSFVSFCVYGAIVFATAMSSNVSLLVQIIRSLSYVLCSASIVLAFLAVFLRFVRKPNRVFDSLQNNAYGMYLFHYVMVSWIQYALLEIHISATSKGFIVFACALLLSWGTSSIIRRIPAIARII